VSGQWLSLDATALVKGNAPVSMALTTTNATARAFSSREDGTSDPQLVVSTTTAPVVAAAGDIACDPASSSYNGGNGTSSECRQKYTSDLLLNRGLAGVLALGDEQYEDGQLFKFQQAYAPSWGRVKAVTHSALGNHEYLDPAGGAQGYFDYFGAAAGDRTKGYDSFNLGAWRLIALNSNCLFVGGCGVGSPQESWLRRDLMAHRNACVLAFWHHPRFSSAGGASTAVQPLWQALYDFGADLVLAGHDHTYERFAPQNRVGHADPARGIREFVVGTGGKSRFNFVTVKPNSEVRNNTEYGVLRLTLRTDAYDWRFQPEIGNTLIDTGSTNCH